MRHAVSRELFAYWSGLCDGRTSPERGDIDPSAIRHILAYTFVLELSGAWADRQVTVRLSGTRLNALFRSELKGRDFLEIWSRSDVVAAESLVDAVVRDRLAVVAGVRGATAGGEAVDLELLLLPLRHHGRTHLRMLGSLAALTNPTWIGLRAVTSLDLLTTRFQPAAPTEPRADGLDGDGAPCRTMTSQTGGEGDGRQVGLLRVYDGGRRDGDLAACRTRERGFFSRPGFSSP